MKYFPRSAVVVVLLLLVIAQLAGCSRTTTSDGTGSAVKK